ncbi:hypothetical protein C0J52_15167 [Blattella germanica]|nr:hypothetical protein C0J52_15167 [Blattella germanica]
MKTYSGRHAEFNIRIVNSEKKNIASLNFPCLNSSAILQQLLEFPQIHTILASDHLWKRHYLTEQSTVAYLSVPATFTPFLHPW